MKRFRFTLETVRDLRDDRQTAAMLVLADRIRTHGHAQSAAEASLRRHRRAQQALAGAGRAAAMLVQADRDRDAARLSLESSAIDLRETTFGVDAARDDLVEARQALERVTHLEAHRRADHRRRQLAEEERELAEMTEARRARAAAMARRGVLR